VARIAGVDLPRDKRIVIGLTYIFGIGVSSAEKILKECDISLDVRVKNLTDVQVSKLREIIDSKYKVEGSLRTETSMNIKRLMDIGCYRGIRHRRGLPVRGQRTHTNARTRKGPRRTVGAKRKKR